MDIIVTGVITQALPIQQGVSQRTGNQWARASYIIEHEHGQYPKRMVFEVANGRIQELNIQVGEQLTVHVNVDVREYPQGSGKFVNSIEAWKVDRQAQQVQQPMAQPMQQQQYVQQPMPQQFPPQVNAQGQPMQQAAPAPMAQQAVQGGTLPFPPAQ